MRELGLPFNTGEGVCVPGDGACLGPGPGIGYCTLGQYADLPLPGPEQDKCPEYSTVGPNNNPFPVPCPVPSIPL